MSATTKTTGFTADERAAMKERARELQAEGRAGKKAADDLEALLAKIAEMSQPDRGLAERIHAIVTSAAPELTAKTWYGMPAYAKDGKVLCFFKPAEKFGNRYATLGFEDPAHLDDGSVWPTSYAITDLTASDVDLIEGLVRKAVG